MKTTEEMIAIMRAFADGKKVQSRILISDTWSDTSDPIWDWHHSDYRIKPEPELRPYKNAEEFFEAQTKHGPFMYDCITTHFIMPVEASNDGVWFYESIIITEWSELIKTHKWKDGTPCGIKEGGEE